jgi:hypothetical protein
MLLNRSVNLAQLPIYIYIYVGRRRSAMISTFISAKGENAPKCHCDHIMRKELTVQDYLTS